MTTIYDLYKICDLIVEMWRKRYAKTAKEFPTQKELEDMARSMCTAYEEMIDQANLKLGI